MRPEHGDGKKSATATATATGLGWRYCCFRGYQKRQQSRNCKSLNFMWCHKMWQSWCGWIWKPWTMAVTQTKSAELRRMGHLLPPSQIDCIPSGSWKLASQYVSPHVSAGRSSQDYEWCVDTTIQEKKSHQGFGALLLCGRVYSVWRISDFLSTCAGQAICLQIIRQVC